MHAIPNPQKSEGCCVFDDSGGDHNPPNLASQKMNFHFNGLENDTTLTNAFARRQSREHTQWMHPDIRRSFIQPAPWQHDFKTVNTPKAVHQTYNGKAKCLPRVQHTEDERCKEGTPSSKWTGRQYNSNFFFEQDKIAFQLDNNDVKRCPKLQIFGMEHSENGKVLFNSPRNCPQREKTS